MSTDTERVEEGTESSLLEAWTDWYHLPVLGAVMLFMFWVRAQSYERFFTDDGTPALAGVDSWYHWRTLQWTSENYPHTMPYEVYTSFPTGRYVGQFGTLFDQLIVTVAMIVGLGDPSTETLYAVALFAIPAMAALVAIPVFYIGRRLGGTVGGIVAVVLLALSRGQFLSRSTVGQLDHHVAEVLFMAIAVLAMMVALRVGEREMPVYELVANREWDPLRQPALYGVLAGLALTLYIWVWPSGVVLIGIFAVFFAVQLCLDYVRGVSPDHVAFVGAVSMGTAAVGTLLLLEQVSTSPTSFGLVQPAAAALVGAGCLFMAWLARRWDGRALDRRYYPAAIAGLLVAAFAVMWLAVPDLYGTIVSNVTRRMLPFGETGTDLTIQEAQPPEDFFTHVYDEFGVAFYTMLVGLALLLARPLLGRRFRAEHALIVVWSLFLIGMAATQVRFAYYLVLAVAVVNAVAVAEVVRFFDLDFAASARSLRQIQTYQIMVVLMVVLLLFAPLLPPMVDAGDHAIDRGESTGPHYSAQVWEESNSWLAENTPAPGDWGGADNASELDPYGTYEAPADGDYDYPDGSYGVMSWWDYGHLITTQGDRIPHANPFQAGARSASAFFTAESEQRSELVLDAIAAGESPAEESNAELEEMADGAGDEEMRYVMIDDQMAGGKFSAITAWTGPGYSHYATPEDLESSERLERDDVAERFAGIPYDDTTLSQLYFDDASGMEHYRLVHEDSRQPTPFVSYALVDPETDQVLLNDDDEPMVAVNQMYDRQIQNLERQSQLNPNVDFHRFDTRVQSSVKTYERVEGATVSGSVDTSTLPENATITATLELETPGQRGAFEYTQEAAVDEDGGFELTVPYATNDELGVDDGYTNSSVEATGDYSLTVEQPVEGNETPTGLQANTSVSETDVVEGGDVEVDPGAFEEVELEDPDDEDEENGDDADGGDGGDGDESNASENETAPSVAPRAAD